MAASPPHSTQNTPSSVTDDQGRLRAADAIIEAATSDWIGPLLAICWGALLLVGTQLPQRLAPLMTADGLTTVDLRALAAMGLTNVGDSLLLWLFAAVTIVVGLVHVMKIAATPSVRHDNDAALAERVALVERTIAQKTTVLWLGKWATVSSHATLDGWRINVGHRALGLAVTVCGFALWAASIGYVCRAPEPVSLEVPVTTKRVRAPLLAKTPGPGRALPAQGHFEGACSRAQQGLVCEFEGLGERANVTLLSGQPAALGDWVATWTHSRTSPDGSSWNLQWRQPDAAGVHRWYSFDTTAQRHATVSSLGIAVTTIKTQRSGPIVIGSISAKGTGKSKAVLAAGPGLLPSGRAELRVASGGSVAILLSRPKPTLAMLIGLLLIVLGVFVTFAIPGVNIHVTKDGVATSSWCNRTELALTVASSHVGVAA